MRCFASLNMTGDSAQQGIQHDKGLNMTDDSTLEKTLNIVIARRTKSDAAIHRFKLLLKFNQKPVDRHASLVMTIIHS
jgi:hypothetical protein